jgi:pimeloyl-ACP methyl ester carboxylesterase
VSLHAETTGPPDAPAIVFLHGIGTSGWMWWRQVPAFPAYRRLTVDLPGHGGSRDVPWTSLADTAGRVAALIRDRTPTGRAHIVGLSLGGHVALELLEHHPDVVDHAVVSGVTAEPWPYPRLLAPQVWLTTLQLRSRRLVDARARSLGLPPAIHAAFAETVRAMDPRTYRRIVEEVSRCALPGSLGTAGTPTLVLAGGRETDIIRRSVVAVPAAMPAATGRIAPAVGHGWNVEAPELFTATVRAWIEDAPLPADLREAAGRR